FFLLLIPLPPISILFPYTTLFRSVLYFDSDKVGLLGTSKLLFNAQGDVQRTTVDQIYNAPADAKYMKVRLLARSNPDKASSYTRSEEHTSELQSPYDLVCRLLLEK